MKSPSSAGSSAESTPRLSLVAQLSGPTRKFLSTEAGSAGLLLGATVTALLWANSPWSGSYESSGSPRQPSRWPGGSCRWTWPLGE